MHYYFELLFTERDLCNMSTNTVSTAFQKAHTSKEIGTFQYVGAVVDQAIMNAVPEAVKDMPKKAVFSISLMGNIAALLVFFSLAFVSYNTAYNQIYLSPVDNPSLCETVPKAMDGTFLIDTAGNWDSSSKFDPTQAVYQFVFRQLEQDLDDYSFMVGALNDTLIYEGNRMLNYTLAENLLVWSSWVAYYSFGGKRQNFYLYSDPAVIFDRQYIRGVVSNQLADCSLQSLTSFDAATYIITTEYDYTQFLVNPTCNTTLDAISLNYRQLFDGNYFNFEVDVRSLVTALAVNTRIIPIDAVEEIRGLRTNYTYHGDVYTISQFYDARYPGNCGHY